MATLTKTEEIRLRNLRALHGRPGGAGGPTSDFLVDFLSSKGVSIGKTDLSKIYWAKKAIGGHLATSIEGAFSLQSGWLSEDHEFLYMLSSGEISAHRELASLPPDLKVSLLSLVRSVASHAAK